MRLIFIRLIYLLMWSDHRPHLFYVILRKLINFFYFHLYHRNVYHSHRKYRRHVNELSGSVSNNRHHLMASSSQLSIEVSELHASNNGRLEITCLATIPAHVGVGEQFADYKTYSVKSKCKRTGKSKIKIKVKIIKLSSF